MAFRLRRGTAAELNNITPAEGELIYTTDTKKLFVGDGVTRGGITTAAGYTGSAGVGYTGSAAGDGSSLFNGSFKLELDALGTLNVPGSISPDTDVSYDLGGPNNRFRDLYLSGNTIYLGQYGMSIDNTGRLRITNSEGDSLTGSDNSLTNNGYEAELSDTGVFTVPGAIVPDDDATHDLGTLDSRFKDLYLSGNAIYLGNYSISIDPNGQLEIFNGDTYTTLGSSLTVDGVYSATLDQAGNLTVPGNITPDSGASWDLGDSNYPFRDIYLSDMIRLGDYHTLTIDDAGLQIDGVNIKEAINLSYLINEGYELAVNSDGTISLPNNTIALMTATDFQINTSSEVQITATVTNPGTGYGLGPSIGMSGTTGGSGTGMTVSFSVTGNNGVGSVTIISPGTGYETGDVLTIDDGNGDAEFQLSISAELYAWTFDSSGNTSLPGKLFVPGKVGFEPSEINENYSAEALVFEKSGAYKGIATSGGTAGENGVEALIIAGGDAYEDPVTSVRTGSGGDITLIAGQGSPGGTIDIISGQGPIPGDINISAGGALVPVSGSGVAPPPGSGSGGIVSIVGGIGNTNIAGGNVVIVGGSGNGGNGGSVSIAGGVGTDNGVDKRGGDVTIQGGIAEDAGGVGGKVQIRTDSTLQGGAARQWDFDVNGVLTVPGSIIPNANITYDLGSANKRFKDIYLSSNTINLGGSSVSVDSGGKLLINGNNAGTELVYFGGEGFGPNNADAMSWDTQSSIPRFSVIHPGLDLQRALYELKIGDKIRISNPPFNYVDDTLTIAGAPTNTYDSSGGLVISLQVDRSPPAAGPAQVFVYALYLPVRSASIALANGSQRFMLTPTGRTVFPTSVAPANDYGVVGDTAGMVAFDNNYVYYCTGNYVDNSTSIWKRISLSTW